jgi:hypothetical protein
MRLAAAGDQQEGRALSLVGTDQPGLAGAVKIGCSTEKISLLPGTRAACTSASRPWRFSM